MVEMALVEAARRAEWDAWYVAHQHRLLTIPGFRASQRFEAIHSAESPFVALHEVDSAEIFASPTYRAQAGPSNTGHRNLFDLAHSPNVPSESRVVVIEDGVSALPAGTQLIWMTSVGLDRSVPRRALAVMSPTTADRLVGPHGIRVLKPIGPRLQETR